MTVTKSPHDPDSMVFPALGGEQVLPLFRPSEPLHVTVGIAPALGFRAEYYGPLARQLSAMGFHVALVDHPGHGLSPVRSRRQHNWGYGDLVTQLGVVRHLLQREMPGHRFFWLGHSIGGQVALMDAGAHPGEVDGVFLVASGTPYHRAWLGWEGHRLHLNSYLVQLLSSGLGYFPGDKVGFGGREARQLMAEWASLARRGSYTFPNFDGEVLLRACMAPVWSIRLEGDDWAPQAAIDHTLNKLPSPFIHREVWSDHHITNPHNRWPRDAAHVVARLKEWVVDPAVQFSNNQR